MQKRHFERAAELVAAILSGHWTHELPSWGIVESGPTEIDSMNRGSLPVDYVRAVWTCEAFEKLFTEWNPRFDAQRFRIACGLVVAPVKSKGRKRAS